MHSTLRVRALDLEGVEAIGHDAQLPIGGSIGCASEHRRCDKRIRVTVVRGALDRVEEFSFDRALERRLGLELGHEVQSRVTGDALQRREKLLRIGVGKKPDVDIRRCLRRNNVGLIGAVQTRERNRVAQNRVPVNVAENPLARRRITQGGIYA